MLRSPENTGRGNRIPGGTERTHVQLTTCCRCECRRGIGLCTDMKLLTLFCPTTRPPSRILNSFTTSQLASMEGSFHRHHPQRGIFNNSSGLRSRPRLPLCECLRRVFESALALLGNSEILQFINIIFPSIKKLLEATLFSV